MGPQYAWMMTEKWDDEENEVYGPKGAEQCMVDELLQGDGEEFKIYDDDGGLMAEGRIINKQTGFEPLDDYAMPSLGATEIHYKNDEGEYEQL